MSNFESQRREPLGTYLAKNHARFYPDEQSKKNTRIEIGKYGRIAIGIACGVLVSGGTVAAYNNLNKSNDSTLEPNAIAKAGVLLDDEKRPESSGAIPKSLDCVDVATLSLNLVTPVEWEIPDFPLSDTTDYPSLGRGTITVESCVGDISDNFDAAASKKSGVQTFTLSPSDFTYKLDLSAYEDGFPEYTPEELLVAMENANPTADQDSLRSAANKLVETVAGFNDERHALHIAELKEMIVDRYGSAIMESARDRAEAQFDAKVAEAGIAPNRTWLQVESTDNKMVITGEDDPPDTASLPFKYLSEETEVNIKAYIITPNTEEEE